MEPWDGPASMTFTDGTVVGAVLDRNGLRPSRIWVTDDGLVVMASEAGVLDLHPSTVVRRMRLQPGRMFLVDTAQGRIVSDEEIKADLAAEHPYQEWLDNGLVPLDELPEGKDVRMPHHRIVMRQLAFGYTYEELNLLVAPMARLGAEPIGSMGTDTPVAVLSQRPRMLYDYFHQLFAQVTNPPLDAIREEVVTSLQGTTGGERDLLNPDQNSCHQIVLPQPILRNHELAKLVSLDPNDKVNGRPHGLRSKVIRCLYRVSEEVLGWLPRWKRYVARRRRQSPTALGSSSCPTASPTRKWLRYRRCSPLRECTTTWFGNGPAPKWVWWSSPVMPARCTTWPRWSDSARPRSTPTWCSSRSRTCSTAVLSRASTVRRR